MKLPIDIPQKITSVDLVKGVIEAYESQLAGNHPGPMRKHWEACLKEWREILKREEARA